MNSVVEPLQYAIIDPLFEGQLETDIISNQGIITLFQAEPR